jgi:phosphoribosylformylglycinamidine synthase PurS subunit
MFFDAEIVITPREGVLDTQGKAVEKTLARLGYECIEEVRVGRVVKLKLDAESEDAVRESAKRMCADLLANDLVETYRISVEAASK